MSPPRVPGMSTTRLLLLGVVRIFQPVNGYQVHRELLSWRVDVWANVRPGSIYSGLRTLAKHGMLDTESAPDVRGESRTTYSLTPDGDKEFVSLLRQALWTVDPSHPERIQAGISFMWILERDEVVAALESRAGQLRSVVEAASFDQRHVLDDPYTPDHVCELIRLTTARNEGELGWTRALLERVRSGSYVFGDEGPPWSLPDARGAPWFADR